MQRKYCFRDFVDSMTDTFSAPSETSLLDAVVTIFGGGGFIGRHTAQALMQAGARVRIAQRNTKNAFPVKALGNLGQVQIVGADITQPDHAARAAIGSDIVINLVGSFDNMDAVHETGARHVAEAAAAVGARALVHVSAMGADANSDSRYFRSKAAGEAATLKAYPNAAIIRPSIVFGQQDQFINRIAALIGKTRMVPVLGGATRVQPAFVGDIAAAIRSVAANGTGGEFDLGGPHILTMQEIFDWVASEVGETPFYLDVPNAVAGGIAKLGFLPGAPITQDQWAMLSRDNVVPAGARGFADLGIQTTALAAVAPGWLDRFRRNGRFTPAIRPTTA